MTSDRVSLSVSDETSQIKTKASLATKFNSPLEGTINGRGSLYFLGVSFCWIKETESWSVSDAYVNDVAVSGMGSRNDCRGVIHTATITMHKMYTCSCVHV